MSLWLFLGPFCALIGLAVGSGEAVAAQPEPWQLGFQPAASPVMAQLESLHDLLLWIITLISIFVLALLAYACVRFRASRNATPIAAHPSYAARDRLDRGAGADPGGDRDPVLQAALLHGPGGGAGDDDQGGRPPVVLELRVSRQRRVHLRRLHGGGRGSAGRPAAAADHRQRRGAAGRHRHPGADHRDRRAALLGGAGVRRQDGRGAGPGQRDLGSHRRSPACTTASAPSCAATTTASCRSWYARSARRSSTPGRSRHRKSSRAPATSTSPSRAATGARRAEQPN